MNGLPTNMEKILIIVLVIVFLLTGCNPSQQNSSNQPTKGKIISAKGKVVQIQRGKDGYTAEIRTDDNKTYSAVISSVDLPKSQYREVKIGDTIYVEGDDLSGSANTIKVTILR